MPIYRKKPIEIEAQQYTGENGHLFRHWGKGEIEEGRDGDGEPPYLSISTPEGVMLCHPGSWVIKGVKGEFYPCKPDIFEATYEETIPF